MEILCLLIGLAGLAACAVTLVRRQREKRRLQEMGEQIAHFLLYAKQPFPETLDEGLFANLTNMISQLEQQLLYQREQSARREREMTRFVENMAHQMKNALTALQIQLDLLSLHISPQAQASLEKSQSCMERLTGEIDRILKSSQLAAGKIAMEPEPIELHREIAACMERLKPLAGAKGVSLALTGRARLSADGFWLSQALENLLKNAVEHTAKGSQVRVSITDSGSRVTVRIEDEGPGIPPEELPELFTRFHRCGVSKAGYGIGLSMAKDIVEAHHGALSAGNRERGGAWFEAQLPRMDSARAYPPPPEVTDPSCGTGL